MYTSSICKEYSKSALFEKGMSKLDEISPSTKVI